MSLFDISKIKGVFAPIATAFDAAGELDFKSLAANMAIWGKTRMQGYVVLGSNGEANFLTFEEKIKLVAEVVKLNRGAKVIIAGTGVETTRETIALTKKVAEVGAQVALDAASLLTLRPPWAMLRSQHISKPLLTRRPYP